MSRNRDLHLGRAPTGEPHDRHVHGNRPRAGVDANATRLDARRSRWRTWLVLSRASNLPTVWTNVAAGLSAAGALEWRASTMRLASAASLMYVAGMFLNDFADRSSDAVHR